MLPELFSVGPFALRSINVVLIVALMIASFIFYRKVREEHFSEMEAFDAFLLSLVIGLVASRLAFVAVHFGEFGWQVWRWADIVTHPGVSGTIGVIVAGWYLFRSAKNFTNDAFQLIDIWSIAMTTGIGIMWLGHFLDGSGYGFATQLPIGVTFTGLIEPHIPIQLVGTLYFLLVAWYLNWVEYRYRTYGWYRSGKTSAQSGFLISIAIIASSLWLLVSSWLRPSQLVLFSIPLDGFIACVGMIFGIGILFHRSGRTLFNRRKKLS